MRRPRIGRRHRPRRRWLRPRHRRAGRNAGIPRSGTSRYPGRWPAFPRVRRTRRQRQDLLPMLVLLTSRVDHVVAVTDYLPLKRRVLTIILLPGPARASGMVRSSAARRPAWTRRSCGAHTGRMRRWVAAAGSSVFMALAPGTVAGLGPWWLTGWRGTSSSPPAKVLGGALVLAGGVVLVQ